MTSKTKSQLRSPGSRPHPITDRQRRVADIIIAKPGVTRARLMREVGISYGQINNDIMALSRRFYLYEEGDKWGQEIHYYIEYEFTRDIPDDDLFCAIFGVPAEEAIAAMVDNRLGLNRRGGHQMKIEEHIA